MNNTIKLVALAGICMLMPGRAQAQDDKVKAIFVYNFTRYLEWPEKPGNFVITVLGKTQLFSELTDISSKKQVGTAEMEVRSVGIAQEISDCHIVYVTSSKTDMIPAIQQSAKNKKFLIISESPGACQKGSCINFINQAGKLTFEISKVNISSYGLTLSSALLDLGVEAK